MINMPGDCVPITWFYTLPLMLPDDVVQCTLHIMMFNTWLWHTENVMLSVMGLIHLKWHGS